MVFVYQTYVRWYKTLINSVIEPLLNSHIKFEKIWIIKCYIYNKADVNSPQGNILLAAETCLYLKNIEPDELENSDRA